VNINIGNQGWLDVKEEGADMKGSDDQYADDADNHGGNEASS
jgi:hypothetical protein